MVRTQMITGEVPGRLQHRNQHHSPLEWSKLIAERYVEYYGAQRNFRACIFRLSTVYARLRNGNEERFCHALVDEAVKRGWAPSPAARRPGRVRHSCMWMIFRARARAFIDSSG